jgi:hypothetical protein
LNTGVKGLNPWWDFFQMMKPLYLRGKTRVRTLAVKNSGRVAQSVVLADEGWRNFCRV